MAGLALFGVQRLATRTPRSRAPGKRLEARGARFLIEAIAKQARQGRLRDALRLGLRSACAPQTSLRWVTALAALEDDLRLSSIPFDLTRKVSRRFLHRALGPNARRALLTSHYAVLRESFSAAGIARLLQNGALPLAAVAGRSGAAYAVTLERSARFEREGEAVLVLRGPHHGPPLATLVFTVGVTEPGGGVDFFIGGLQGCSLSAGKTLTVEATRDLYGLRPKDLLTHAAYAVADRCRARAILAISDACHVHRAPGRERSWSASYDAFWSELGGVPLTTGFYLLPRERRRRSPGAVAPSKRKLWLKRQATIGSLRADVFAYEVWSDGAGRASAA